MLKKNDKKYHHGDLKRALVEAGLEILEESGLEKLTLRAIAARVGVSHTAPKNHFDSLNDLLAAVAAEGFREHAAAMQIGVEGTSPGEERLAAATAGYVQFARENPALFRLMFSPRFNESHYPELEEAGQASYQVLSDIAKGLDWPRRVQTEDAGLEAFRTEYMLWVFAHGYASLMIEGRGPKKPDGAPLLDVLDVMPDFRYPI